MDLKSKVSQSSPEQSLYKLCHLFHSDRPEMGAPGEGPRGDTPGEFKVEHLKILYFGGETLQNLYKTLMRAGVGTLPPLTGLLFGRLTNWLKP